MKNALPVLTAALLLLMGAVLGAGEISIYQDKDGVINLTDKPAPSGTRVQDVIRYKKKSPADFEKQQQLDEQRRHEFRRQQENQRGRELRINADKASKQAEEESVLARETIKVAEEYLERYNSKKKSQRRRHRKKAQSIVKEAQDAQTRANATITRANQAQKDAREASAKASEGKD